MANFEGWCRSSYFKVKSEEDFLQWLREWDCEVIYKDSSDGMLMGFISNWEGGIPCGRENYEDEGPDDFLEQLTSHIDKGWLAIVNEVGFEGDHYAQGSSWAVRSDGKILSQHLDQLTKRRGVKEWKKTDCMY